MNIDPAPDPFEMDDAAYVLGALRGAERAAFEAHLRTCPDCTARVAELRDMPALLADITEADLAAAERAAGADPVPDTLLPSLLRAVRTERRHRRGLFAGLASVAAACALALTLVLAWPSGHAHSAPVAMTAVQASPVRATAQLDSADWGTAITLVCHYTGSYAANSEYSLVVVRKDGKSEVAGSWDLTPGEATTFHGGTAWPKAQISKVEIVSGDTELLQLKL
jgi:anti-sigma-K factor RskA